MSDKRRATRKKPAGKASDTGERFDLMGTTRPLFFPMLHRERLRLPSANGERLGVAELLNRG